MAPDPPDREPTGAGGRTAAKRDRLLAAAYAQLIDTGYSATTVQSIARRAGLSNATIYGQFVTKDRLLLKAVLRHGVLQDEGDGDFDDLITRLARHQSTAPTPDHRAFTEVLGAAIPYEGKGSPLRRLVERLESAARGPIDRAKAQGRLGEHVSTDALAAIVVDLHLGAITAKALGLPQPSHDDVLAVLDVLGRGPNNSRPAS